MKSGSMHLLKYCVYSRCTAPQESWALHYSTLESHEVKAASSCRLATDWYMSLLRHRSFIQSSLIILHRETIQINFVVLENQTNGADSQINSLSPHFPVSIPPTQHSIVFTSYSTDDFRQFYHLSTLHLCDKHIRKYTPSAQNMQRKHCNLTVDPTEHW